MASHWRTCFCNPFHIRRFHERNGVVFFLWSGAGTSAHHSGGLLVAARLRPRPLDIEPPALTAAVSFPFPFNFLGLEALPLRWYSDPSI